MVGKLAKVLSNSCFAIGLISSVGIVMALLKALSNTPILLSNPPEFDEELFLGIVVRGGCLVTFFLVLDALEEGGFLHFFLEKQGSPEEGSVSFSFVWEAARLG